MKKNVRNSLALNTLGVLLLCNWGTNEQNVSVTGGGKKPEVNFFGHIIDNTENVVAAEYITFSGAYRQVPVYLLPKDLNKKDYNPADNTARLDLAEISIISIPEPEKIYTFLNRTYLEINVLSRDNQTSNSYIIESSKKIYFDEVNSSGPIEREIALTAIKEIHIEGYEETVKSLPKKAAVALPAQAPAQQPTNTQTTDPAPDENSYSVALVNLPELSHLQHLGGIYLDSSDEKSMITHGL